MSRFTFRAVSVVLMLVGLSRAQAAPDFTAAQTEAVKFLGDLVKIDTSNPPGNETRAAEYIKGVLAARRNYRADLRVCSWTRQHRCTAQRQRQEETACC